MLIISFATRIIFCCLKNFSANSLIYSESSFESITLYKENKDEKNEQLKESLKEVEDNYDYIIIDCPPSLGLLTTNALVSSNSVIIPVQCEFFALEGVSHLMNTIQLVQQNIHRSKKR